MRPARADAGSDRGAAVVDFALVGGLLTLLFVSVLQLGLLLHVRNTLRDCAFEGARYGARSDRSAADAVARARALVTSELSSGYASRLTDVQAREVDVGDMRTVEVSLRGPLPLIALLGPSGGLSVTAHAFADRP